MILTGALENIPEKIYSDKFDVSNTSSLSLFLFDQKAIIFSKNQNGTIVAVHQIIFDEKKSLIHLLKEDNLFQMDAPTQIFVHQKHFSLVPGMLFDKSYATTYLTLVGDNTADKQAFHTGLESNDFQLLGSLDAELWQFFMENKTDIHFHHGASSFLSYVLNEKSNFAKQELMIMLFGKQCYIAAFNHQELILFNWFEIDSKDNLLQYIFGIHDQLKFNRNHCQVSVFGEWEKMDITSEWGNRYFKNFKTSVPKQNLQYQNGAEIFMESHIFESFWQFQQ